MNQTQSGLTALLQRAGQGDDNARSAVFDVVQNKLHGMAQARLRSENPGHTLQATVLVHDAYLQLVGTTDQDDSDAAKVDFNNRKHFYVLAAKAMRRILVDHARKRRAVKRGGPNTRRSNAEIDRIPDARTTRGALDDVLALHAALKRLADINPRQAETIELRHFGGYSVEETADLLGVSPRTVKNDFAAAKAWLFRELSTD